jgi:hypothetical protein
MYCIFSEIIPESLFEFCDHIVVKFIQSTLLTPDIDLTPEISVYLTVFLQLNIKYFPKIDNIQLHIHTYNIFIFITIIFLF